MNATCAKITGWLLVLSILLSLLSTFSPDIPGYLAGIPIWICSLLFFPYLKTGQKKQASVVAIVGMAALLYSVYHGINQQYLLQALEANQKVVCMLISVGFLKVIIRNNVTTQQKLPKGKKALSNTMLSTHLFGCVLNVSSVVIVGDKLLSARALSSTQGLLLLRAFCTCSLWSPFFAAMGLTLVSVPGTELGTLVMYGLTITVIALLFTSWEVLYKTDISELEGFPLALHSLWIPSLLAVIVLVTHYQLPDVSVLTIVTLTSLVFSVFWLVITHGKEGLIATKQHIETGVSDSKSEVVLFVCAALLASGLAALIVSLNLNVVPDQFGAFEASMTVLILIVLAMIGMHPVTSIVLIGSILAPSVSDPNLLGLSLLMGCSMGIGLSPFSGVQLTIQNRYSISPITLLKMNKHYAIVMFPVCCAMLWVYSIQVGL